MATGQEIVARAEVDVARNAPYVWGAVIPKHIPNYQGAGDCAEWLSYWYYQVAGILFGTSNHDKPETADAWTGFWLEDGRNPERGKLIPVEEAATIPGAVMLRKGSNHATGHVALCDGQGGTREGYSSGRGVIRYRLDDRRWDTGILVNGIEYEKLPTEPPAVPNCIYRLIYPNMQGRGVEAIQLALIRHHLNPGKVDGFYGNRTFNAVLQFQEVNGLLRDGEVGPQTWGKLGLGEIR